MYSPILHPHLFTFICTCKECGRKVDTLLENLDGPPTFVDGQCWECIKALIDGAGI